MMRARVPGPRVWAYINVTLKNGGGFGSYDEPDERSCFSFCVYFVLHCVVFFFVYMYTCVSTRTKSNCKSVGWPRNTEKEFYKFGVIGKIKGIKKMIKQQKFEWNSAWQFFFSFFNDSTPTLPLSRYGFYSSTASPRLAVPYGRRLQVVSPGA